MDISDLRPPTPEVSWRLGTWVAAASTFVLAASAALDRASPITPWVLVIMSAAIVLAASTDAASRLTSRRRSWIMYLWAGSGFLALMTWMVALDNGPLRYVGLLSVAVVSAAGSFPRRGALAFGGLALTVAAVAWATAGSHASILAASVAGLLVVMLFSGAVNATSTLRRTIDQAARAEELAATRNRLLAVAGRTVSLDVRGVATQVVQAVTELGFEMASLGLLVDGYRVHIATIGFGDRPLGAALADEGLGGRALAERRTVWVEDYAVSDSRVHLDHDIGSAVAVPLIIGGQVIGVLVGARRDIGEPLPDDLIVLEVLAEHAAYAISNAYRFRDEQQVVDRLRHLDAMKRDLVANVSHDLRTPLASVKGIAETLQLRGGALDAATASFLLDRMGENVARLGDMIDGLLDFRSASTGSLEGARTELYSVIDACLWRLSPQLDQHRVEVSVPHGLAVAAPVKLLDHVLENLLGNAAKYTPTGTRLTIAAVARGDHVHVTVADRGPGIPSEDVPKLTQRFWRGDTAHDQAGTGLGLSLVETMLTELGSTLEHSPTPGGGATFGFRLPVSKSAPVGAEGPTP